MKQKEGLPDKFLKAFIFSVLGNVKVSSLPNEEVFRKEVFSSVEDVNLPMSRSVSKVDARVPLVKLPRQTILRKDLSGKGFGQQAQEKSVQNYGSFHGSQSNFQGMQASMLKPRQTGDISDDSEKSGKDAKLVGSDFANLGKIRPLITDPRVQGVECPGPGKNVLVRKDGMVQRTQVSLNKDEIKRIIDDFSKKTKIPLISGTFKAALGNLIISAIVSDFVGSRFVIQKKSPFDYGMRR